METGLSPSTETSILQAAYLSFSLSCCDNVILTEATQGTRAYLGSQYQGPFIMATGAWSSWSTVMKKAMDTHVQCIFSFYTAKDLSPRNSVSIHSGYIFINIIKSIPHRHAQRATSQVILKVIKLPMILTIAGPQDSPALLRTEVLASSRCTEVSSQSWLRHWSTEVVHSALCRKPSA